MRRMRALVRRLLDPAAGGEGLVAAAPRLPLREVLRRFWPYARPHRRWLLAVLALIAVGQAIDAATLWMFKVVVDEVLVPRDFGPFLWVAGAYVGLTVAGGLVSFADDYLSTWVGERFLLSLRTDFFRHLQGLSLDFFARRRLGGVLSRVTENVGAFRAEMASTRLKAIFTPLVDLIELMGAIVVLGFGTWALSQGRLSLGALLAFLAYLSQLYSPIRGLSRLVNRFFSASAGAERIIELLDETPSVAEHARARPLGRARGSVRFDGVSFSYPRGARPALDGLS